MPDKNRRSLIIDRDEIRRNIDHFDYLEARRRKGPIYDAIEKEMYEAGCSFCARELRCSVRCEEQLFSNSTIKKKLSSDRKLLYTLVENAMQAELAFQTVGCDGYYKSMHLIEKNLDLLEPLRVHYDWLLRRLYEIAFKIGHRFVGRYDGTDKVVAGIYYKFACYLSAKIADWEQGIAVLRKAVPMVRGKNWQLAAELSAEGRQTLHEAICRKLAHFLIALSNHIVMKDAAKAIKLSSSSITTVAEIGVETNRVLMCRAYLAHGRALYEDWQVRLALKELGKIRLHDKTDACVKDERLAMAKVHCRMNVYIAACYLHLEEDHEVPQHLYAALSLARQYEFRRGEGETLLMLGKMYSKRLVRNVEAAKEAFEEAKAIFSELADLNAITQTTYLLAKLKVDDIFPEFLYMTRTSPDRPCTMHKLRQWKNLCKPYWCEPQDTPCLEGQKPYNADDPLECLIHHGDADNGDDDIEARKKSLLEMMEKPNIYNRS